MKCFVYRRLGAIKRKFEEGVRYVRRASEVPAWLFPPLNFTKSKDNSQMHTSRPHWEKHPRGAMDRTNSFFISCHHPFFPLNIQLYHACNVRFTHPPESLVLRNLKMTYVARNPRSNSMGILSIDLCIFSWTLSPVVTVRNPRLGCVLP